MSAITAMRCESPCDFYWQQVGMANTALNCIHSPLISRIKVSVLGHDGTTRKKEPGSLGDHVEAPATCIQPRGKDESVPGSLRF